MCGVVGLVAKPGKAFAYPVFAQLMKEARIRGQHATGVSWYDGRLVHTEKQAVPENQFIYPNELQWDDTVVSAIGHLRYSTSDLRFNQPFGDTDISIVHNGVISQEPPETWDEQFGVNCYTANDSEIIYRWLCGNNMRRHPLDMVDTSQAVIGLERDAFFFWRNEQRPLYYYEHDDYIAVASTRDILRRAGLIGRVQECHPCFHYEYKRGIFTSKKIRQPLQDLQNV